VAHGGLALATSAHPMPLVHCLVHQQLAYQAADLALIFCRAPRALGSAVLTSACCTSTEWAAVSAAQLRLCVMRRSCMLVLLDLSDVCVGGHVVPLPLVCICLVLSILCHAAAVWGSRPGLLCHAWLLAH
jgi:hypothetical protein